MSTEPVTRIVTVHKVSLVGKDEAEVQCWSESTPVGFIDHMTACVPLSAAPAVGTRLLVRFDVLPPEAP